MKVEESELVLNSDGSVYHLHLKDEQIADYIILVGDPDRVSLVSSFFQAVEFKTQNREFITVTGSYNGKRVTVISTGIGPDNIDIVVNELDAAVNFDPKTRQQNNTLRHLNIIRIGTCGALQPNLPIPSVIVSEVSMGLDGLRHFYNIQPNDFEKTLETEFNAHLQLPENFNKPYATSADPVLFDMFKNLGACGITITANGFYGPQGRKLRLPVRIDSFNQQLATFESKSLKALNYEMESAALFTLGKALGHRCACLCVAVSNRASGKFTTNHHEPIKKLVQHVLNRLAV